MCKKVKSIGSSGLGKRWEGFWGISIKDTWTKPKAGGAREGGGDGWSGEEWWGQNGDNCT